MIRRWLNDRWRLRNVACRRCHALGWWRLRHPGGHVRVAANPPPARAVTVNGLPVDPPRWAP